MVLILKDRASDKQIKELTAWLESFGVTANVIIGAQTTVMGLVGDTSALEIETVQGYECVDKVMKVQEPYKRVNRKFHPDNTVIKVNDVLIGAEKIAVMAGPCSVEGEDQILQAASAVKQAGAGVLRGGAFKPRTSPYSFQGLRAEGLMLLKKASLASGLPVISEITNMFYVDMFIEYVDIIQVGARNMQNFELLKELGKTNKPILLKRGFANTIEELLMSAEYIMSEGNDQVILCERGIRTFETTTRNTLDISAIPVLKAKTHLPIVVDPSHAAGSASLVEPLSLASIAAGADGLLIEAHYDPANAVSDGAQSLTHEALIKLIDKLKLVATAVGRTI